MAALPPPAFTKSGITTFFFPQLKKKLAFYQGIVQDFGVPGDFVSNLGALGALAVE
jgi:RNAse (barnase) inhibitor barstar